MTECVVGRGVTMTHRMPTHRAHTGLYHVVAFIAGREAGRAERQSERREGARDAGEGSGDFGLSMHGVWRGGAQHQGRGPTQVERSPRDDLVYFEIAFVVVLRARKIFARVRPRFVNFAEEFRRGVAEIDP